MNSARFPRVGFVRRMSTVPENDQIHHPIRTVSLLQLRVRVDY
jgi:hypothetical protein